jgi:hypothetical protein
MEEETEPTLEEIIAEREACGGCPQCPPMPGALKLEIIYQ